MSRRRRLAIFALLKALEDRTIVPTMVRCPGYRKVVLRTAACSLQDLFLKKTRKQNILLKKCFKIDGDIIVNKTIQIVALKIN